MRRSILVMSNDVANTAANAVTALPSFLQPGSSTWEGSSALQSTVTPGWMNRFDWSKLRVTLTGQLPRALVAVIGFSCVAVGWQQLQNSSAAATGSSVYNNEIEEQKQPSPQPTNNPIASTEIVVYVGGAVQKSGLYTIPSTARIGEAIEAADGLQRAADAVFVQKEMNLAGKLKDGDKIYVPFQGEKALEQLLTQSVKDTSGVSSSQSQGVAPEENTISVNNGAGVATYQLISINTASQAQLDELPGIGAARATAIIESRPYQSKEELVGRKILSQGIYAQIEDLIGL